MSTPQAHFPGGIAHLKPINGAQLAVETVGHGPAVLLVHGFPHTRIIWRSVAADLARRGFRAVALDMRGVGDSAPTVEGFSVQTLAADLIGTLEAVGVETAHVVALDLGAAPAVAAAALQPARVATLTVSEALIGNLPGAENFLTRGMPWWFGLHQAPEALAENLIAGHEQAYVEHFLTAGTRRPVPEDIRRTLVEGYTGRQRLHAAFSQYREMPRTAAWIDRWVTMDGRLEMPVLALAGGVVGTATARQLTTIATNLSVRQIHNAGHIVPLDDSTAMAHAIADHGSSLSRAVT
ncbi:alpha/beta fold hydrolase [Gordonia polyisoprenivorans]|nr:alpha/beta fold hydrolase [Gordonia polyisoprenivorans]